MNRGLKEGQRPGSAGFALDATRTPMIRGLKEIFKRDKRFLYNADEGNDSMNRVLKGKGMHVKPIVNFLYNIR